MNCGKCKKKLGKKGYRLQCTGDCNEWFHQRCANLTDEEAKLVKCQKKAWICQACDGDDNEDTSDSEDESSSSEEEVKRGKKKTSAKYTLEDVMSKLDMLIQQNEDLRNKLEYQEKVNREMKKEIRLLKENQSNMERDVQILKNERNKREQNKLSNNIIISGLPALGESEEENKKLVIEVGRRLKVDIGVNDLACGPIGKREKTQLKVSFTKNEIKNKIMEAKRNTQLDSTHLGFSEKKTVYINHDLTFENQQLFKKTRDFKRQMNYKFAWISDGKILLKKNEGSKTIEVDSEEKLNKLEKPKN